MWCVMKHKVGHQQWCTKYASEEMWRHLIDLLNYRTVAHVLASWVKHTPMFNPCYYRKRAAWRLALAASSDRQLTGSRLNCTPLEFRTGFLARGCPGSQRLSSCSSWHPQMKSWTAISILAIFTATHHQSTTVYPHHACLEAQHWKGSGMKQCRVA